MVRVLVSTLLLAFLGADFALAAKDYTRTEDVIYGRKYGTALTLDVFTPAEPNGLGLIFVVSGGWYSSHEAIAPVFVTPFLEHGYTVFAVVHGSQPKYTIPEILKDMHRASRFIRAHAESYGIDPDRMGIYGASAGGHLSLMQGVAGTPGDPEAEDPVERVSSRVQAVACFFPPTDFLNYGKKGRVALGTTVLKNFYAPFDFQKLVQGENATFGSVFKPVTDPKQRRAIGRNISPIYHVSPDDPPTLIIHGDADQLVPIQQAKTMVEALKKAGVETRLVIREGRGHGWADFQEDLELFADWFDEHLKGAEEEGSKKEAGSPRSSARSPSERPTTAPQP